VLIQKTHLSKQSSKGYKGVPILNSLLLFKKLKIMNKIIEVALTGKFGADAVTNLMEVIGATCNPEMATEILLGIYVKPIIPHTVISKSGIAKTVVSIDYWNTTVTCCYEEAVMMHLYVDQDLDTSILTLDNYMEYEKQYSDNNRKSFRMPTGEMRSIQDNCSFNEWLSFSDANDYSLTV